MVYLTKIYYETFLNIFDFYWRKLYRKNKKVYTAGTIDNKGTTMKNHVGITVLGGIENPVWPVASMAPGAER